MFVTCWKPILVCKKVIGDVEGTSSYLDIPAGLKALAHTVTNGYVPCSFSFIFNQLTELCGQHLFSLNMSVCLNGVAFKKTFICWV